MTLNIAPAIVEIEFTQSSQTTNFVLNDATKGVLNGTTYLLGGPVWTDVTDRAYQTSIDRGKNQALSRYNAGTMSVTLDNSDAYFDPTIPAGTPGYPYAGQIIPGKRVRVTVGTELQFVGVIQDWNLDYPLGATPTASVFAADAFVQLANRTLDADTFTTALSSSMLTTVLDQPEVAFDTSARDIGTGVTTLQTTTVALGENVLTFCQLIEASEPGALFVSKEGLLTFRSRRYNPTYSGAIVITDDGTSVTPQSIEVEYGSELLYNRATIQRAGGTTQVADDTASQAIYGIFAYSASGLLMETDAVALSMAQYYANTYGEPVFRPKRVILNMAAQTGSNQGQLQALDLDDLVLIRFTPPGGLLIERYMLVAGIHHRVAPGRHLIDLDLIDANDEAMIYGNGAVAPEDQPLSLLDSNRYGF
ncbi:hypothetical protein UFOVP433_34 [uncultured Caudovirales phage]|uniref:Uncharacterized protein n=1 Tax=uncultured Caudovirales phage TaxID=2100421 RepID=A0A6J5M9E3_9CAUD|nr:hypothetical protein UFOVP433_34 [uncultured Caudovirales phage]CAB4158345.1 hypothetical protein UFOVP702_2 [uncultured Caudovirales phage]